ncbi:MAG: Thiol peroxidase, Bcp-type [Labilithrix sp.]|nr:Thiol peroxidase, Bcp-type [Labilithrix sp.]
MIARRGMLVGLGMAALLGASTLAGCGEPKRPDGGSGLLGPGAAAPDVAGEDPAGHVVRLSESRGKAVVVYFYPADGTPGCTKEACAFRDAWSKLDQAGIVVLGVSSNSAESHRKFQKEHNLPFALAADESGTIASSYGVGKKLWGYDRVSFLVGKDGKVAKVWPSVDPGVHAGEVIAEAAKLPQGS